MHLPFSPREDPYTCQLILSISNSPFLFFFVPEINLDNLNYYCIVVFFSLSLCRMIYNIEAVLDFYFHRNKFVLSRRITPFLFFLQMKFRFF